jgi:photosystem II stability/assembly factor-like uncharacterized protein
MSMMKLKTTSALTILLCAFTLGATITAQPLGSWERISHRSTFSLWDVAFTDSLFGIAVGDFGVILRSTDGGESWEQKLSGDQFAFRHVHFFDDSTGIAAGFRSTCFRTENAGATWQSVTLPTDGDLPGMAVIDDIVWLSGAEGTILKSTDRGKTWKQLSTDTDVMLGSISFATTRVGWAASIQRKLLYTDDGGENWTEQSVDSFLPVTTVCARSATECWLAGYHGLMLRSIDGGKSWQEISAYDTDYVSLTFDVRGIGWAVGKRGAVVRSEVGNLRWRLHDLTSAKTLTAVAMLPNNQAIAVGDDGAIFKLREVYSPPPPNIKQ